MNRTAQIEFMTFWLTINKVLASRGNAEMLWGEARQVWKSANEEQASVDHDWVAQRLNQKAVK